MTREVIIGKLTDIIREELRLGEGMNITGTTTLSDIGVDSIALMQLLVYIEEQFDFEFGENVILQGGIMSINDLTETIIKEKAK
jgi:acyl carrier protein